MASGSSWNETSGLCKRRWTFTALWWCGTRSSLDEHITLTKLLGGPEVVTDMRNHHPDSLDVLVVNNLGRTPVIGNLCWHSDLSFLKKSTRYTILHSIVVPNGNIPMDDTLFADMVGPYAEAPDDWKHVMDGANGMHIHDKTARLRAQLHNTEIEEYESRYPPVHHPLVHSCCHQYLGDHQTQHQRCSPASCARIDWSTTMALWFLD